MNNLSHLHLFSSKKKTLPFPFFFAYCTANIGKNCIFCMLLQEILCGDAAINNVWLSCPWMYIGIFCFFCFFSLSYWPWTQTTSVREKKRSIVYLIAFIHIREKNFELKKVLSKEIRRFFWGMIGCNYGRTFFRSCCVIVKSNPRLFCFCFSWWM